MDISVGSMTTCSMCGKTITYIEEKRGREGAIVRLWAHKELARHPATPFSVHDLTTALEESLTLQRHYAELLNMYDNGERMTFDGVKEWIVRLKKVGKLPQPNSQST